jgi:hypothetical protein
MTKNIQSGGAAFGINNYDDIWTQGGIPEYDIGSKIEKVIKTAPQNTLPGEENTGEEKTLTGEEQQVINGLKTNFKKIEHIPDTQKEESLKKETITKEATSIIFNILKKFTGGSSKDFYTFGYYDTNNHKSINIKDGDFTQLDKEIGTENMFTLTIRYRTQSWEKIVNRYVTVIPWIVVGRLVSRMIDNTSDRCGATGLHCIYFEEGIGLFNMISQHIKKSHIPTGTISFAEEMMVQTFVKKPFSDNLEANIKANKDEIISLQTKINVLVTICNNPIHKGGGRKKSRSSSKFKKKNRIQRKHIISKKNNF